MPFVDEVLRQAIRPAALAMGALVVDVTLAQPAVPAAALEACAAIERGVERLDCYDALARRVVGDAAAVAPASAPFPPAAPADAAIDAFGRELIENEGLETPREIQSRLIGGFTGWRGNTEFRLENGQVWRQAEEGRLVHEADAPLVTIRRGAFNSYRLSIEGVNSTVRVRRIE